MDEIIIKGIKLIKTCDACPEQYNAFNGQGKLVGYLRLRHGYFSVRYPNSSGKEIYNANPTGDGLFDYDERDFFLKEAVKAIKKEIKNEER
jgi:hypothetical protein